MLTITGSGFRSRHTDVWISSSACVIRDISLTEIICEIGAVTAGNFSVMMNITTDTEVHTVTSADTIMFDDGMRLFTLIDF